LSPPLGNLFAFILRFLSRTVSSLVTAKLRFRLTKNNKSRRNQIVRGKAGRRILPFYIFIAREGRQEKQACSIEKEEGDETERNMLAKQVVSLLTFVYFFKWNRQTNVE
jgi:hypothetical protein